MQVPVYPVFLLKGIGQWHLSSAMFSSGSSKRFFGNGIKKEGIPMCQRYLHEGLSQKRNPKEFFLY